MIKIQYQKRSSNKQKKFEGSKAERVCLYIGANTESALDS